MANPLDAATPTKLGTRPRLNVAIRREGRGTPVLFVNSLAADLSMWRGVVDRLDDRPLAAFDARGHGGTEVIAGSTTVADLAADALAVMDEAGFRRAAICGLSLGGVTAMAMAEAAPERVAGLILANTAVNFPPAQMWRERAAGARRDGMAPLVDATLERWLTPGFRTRTPEAEAAVGRMVASVPPEGYAACCEALAEADGSQALSAWGGPTLVIAGAQDPSTTVARAEEMVGLAPQAELVTLEAAHLSAVEDPAGFAEALLGFLRRLDAKGAADA